MPIYLRNGIYWIDIRHQGQRIRRTSGTADEQQAQRIHDQIKADLWKNKHLNEPMPRSFAEAVDKWLKENDHMKSMRDRQEKLIWLVTRIGDLPVNRVDGRVIEGLIESKQQETFKGKAVSNATVNRHMSALSVILKACETWKWIESAPRIRQLDESPARGKFFTREIVVKVVSELPFPHCLIFSFALMTGQRMSNILNLRWQDVDLENECFWIWDSEFKSGHAHNVPLNEDALAILDMAHGQNDTFVFVGRGNKPLKRMSGEAWYDALDRAGVPHGERKGFTFHHTRHTWASFHTMNGTPRAVLQELGGWRTASMLERYSHLAPGHSAKFAGNVKLTK